MSKRNENRPGYKKTKVGWIPEEWTPVKLGNCFKLASGETKPSIISEYPNNKENVPVYGGNGILGYTSQVFDDCKCIIIGRVGEKCGCVHLVKGPHFITDNALFTKAWLIDVSIEYFAYFLDYFKLSRLRNKGGQPLVSQKPIYALTIPLPPLPEQKKIAEILSAWDRAIEQVGRLIDAKQRLKKGLMQQLLTGRMRFPEFGKPVQKNGGLPEGWREVQLKDVAAILFSGVDKKSRPVQKKVRLCNYMDVYNNNYITADMDFMWATATDAEITAYSLDVGDIMITKDSETSDDIGIPAVVMERLDNVLCGYHLALIKPNLEKTDPIFLTKQIGYEQVANQFSRLANGATRFGLTTSSVKGVKLWLPELEEQSRIAAILSICDREIELLKKRQEKLKEQKKGLMQKLLTGEVRVKV